MSDLRLIIGDKTRSSWSLRPWMFLTHHGVPFAESVIELDRPETRVQILKHSPSGRVPVLVHGEIKVWESLAICEYAAEAFALPKAWPLEPAARALARSIAAEMHAGFAELRKEMPFNPTLKPEKRKLSDAAAADVARIGEIWREARGHWGKGKGDWLFGAFGIVDAMFAPVALRFHTYGVQLKGAEMDYVFSVLAHPAVQEWVEAAEGEAESRHRRPVESALERTAELPMPVQAAPAGTTPAKAAAPAPELPRIKSIILPPD
jgi:glutathione S-transferase